VPRYPPANRLQAVLAYGRGDFELARSSAELAIEGDKQDLLSLLIGAAASYEVRSYEQADRHVRAFLARVPARIGDETDDCDPVAARTRRRGVMLAQSADDWSVQDVKLLQASVLGQ